MEVGQYPVLSQGAEEVEGYWDEADDVLDMKGPDCFW